MGRRREHGFELIGVEVNTPLLRRMLEFAAQLQVTVKGNA